MEAAVIDWLLKGDPVIRWQTMRDLQDAPPGQWQAEQQRVLKEGWVAGMLAFQDAEGRWPEGRWTGTLWTLLVLLDCGLPAEHPASRWAAERILQPYLALSPESASLWMQTRMDLCHLGFWLRLGSHFLGNDPRLRGLADMILQLQLADGGWNCRIRNYPKTVHSSFHTTFNVLEGLRPAADCGLVPATRFREAEARALEFMLAHRMYKSDKTGAVVDERFTHLTFPSHWHYTVLRGLDYLRSAPQIGDAQLADACALLESRRKATGRWPVEKRIPGTTLIEMEKPGGDSRWNTLRALRVLKARERAIAGKASA